MTIRDRAIGFLLTVLAALAYPLTASSNEELATGDDGSQPVPAHPALNDRFMFMLGGYYPSTSTAARLDANTGVGVVVDFEDALDLEDSKLVLESEFLWRINERWRLDTNYFSLNRSSSRVLQEEINWGDVTFPIGADVDSQFKISDLRAAVGYSFFRRRDKELGIGIGIHATKFEASIESTSGAAEATDVSAPLPVVNFYATMALTDTWAMNTRLDWLSLSYEDYSGDIRFVALDFLYQPFERVGFGFGYHGLLYDLEMDSTDWRGRVRLQVNGPSAFVTASF
jgi:hypothetical protein